MDTRPSPLVPADATTAGLDGFILNVDRLLASELFSTSSPEEFKAAVTLWCRAWQQTPPGSLPNSDKILRAFSGSGGRWVRVKDMALRGFVECSDGRLYHKVLCEDVMRVLRKRDEFRARTAAATESRKGGRRRHANDRGEPAEPPGGMDGLHRNDDRNDPRNDDRNVVAGNRADVERNVRSGSVSVEKEEEEKKESLSKPVPYDSGRAKVQTKLAVADAFRAAGAMATPDTFRVERWLSQGYAPDLIVAVVREGLAKTPGVRSLAYFDPMLREAHEQRPKAPLAAVPEEPRVNLGGGYIWPYATIREALERWLAKDCAERFWPFHFSRATYDCRGIPIELFPPEVLERVPKLRFDAKKDDSNQRVVAK
jgi:hypothetical protein